jgi:hypothetical protein
MAVLVEQGSPCGIVDSMQAHVAALAQAAGIGTQTYASGYLPPSGAGIPGGCTAQYSPAEHVFVPHASGPASGTPPSDGVPPGLPLPLQAGSRRRTDRTAVMVVCLDRGLFTRLPGASLVPLARAVVQREIAAQGGVSCVPASPPERLRRHIGPVRGARESSPAKTSTSEPTVTARACQRVSTSASLHDASFSRPA